MSSKKNCNPRDKNTSYPFSPRERLRFKFPDDGDDYTPDKVSVVVVLHRHFLSIKALHHKSVINHHQHQIILLRILCPIDDEFVFVFKPKCPGVSVHLNDE